MGAISKAVGNDGAVYTDPQGKQFKLTGWTFAVLSDHESYLEKRAVEALKSKASILSNDYASMMCALMERIACFSFSYGSEAFASSLKQFGGLGHMFWLLARTNDATLTLDQAVEMVKADPVKIYAAVHEADPQNRATADNPKGEGDQK